MDTDTTHPTDQAASAEQNGRESASSSILDDVRAMREQAASEDERRLTLPVPGYGGRFGVIYHYPEGGYQKAVQAVEREMGKDPNARVEGNADLLVAACLAVVGINEDGANIDPITNELLGDGIPASPMRFDRKLAEALGIEIAPEVRNVGRVVVRALFSPRGAATGVYDGDLALISTSNMVFGWLNGAEVERDKVLMGE